MPGGRAGGGHRPGLMRIHRGYLFWGVFFVLLGALPLAEREGWIDGQRLGDVGRLWPLIIVAMGIAVMFSHTRLSALGTVVVAVVLGLMAGGVLAFGTAWVPGLGDCAAGSDASLQRTTQSGTFSSGASVALTLSCGTLSVSTGDGSSWTLDAAHRGEAPSVGATGSSLSVRAARDGIQRQEWSLVLPGAQLSALDVTANAAQSTLSLAAATLTTLHLQSNAADVLLDATATTISDLQVGLNAGRARLTLGGATTGAIQVNAGEVRLCVPPEATLAITVHDQFALDTNLEQRGLTQAGDTWKRTGSTGAPLIQLEVQGNAASFTLDPTGGCR